MLFPDSFVGGCLLGNTGDRAAGGIVQFFILIWKSGFTVMIF